MLKERLEDVFPSHWFSLLLTPTLLPREHGPGLLQNSLHHYSRKKNMRPNIVAWYMVEFHSIYLDLLQMLTNTARGCIQGKKLSSYGIQDSILNETESPKGCFSCCTPSYFTGWSLNLVIIRIRQECKKGDGMVEW